MAYICSAWHTPSTVVHLVESSRSAGTQMLQPWLRSANTPVRVVVSTPTTWELVMLAPPSLPPLKVKVWADAAVVPAPEVATTSRDAPRSTPEPWLIAAARL